MSIAEQTQQAIDVTLSTAGSKATYAGAGISTVSWITSSEFGMLAGIVIGVVGLAINFYYSRKRDAREQAEHQLKMLLRKDTL
jgi:hypothetical protein